MALNRAQVALNLIRTMGSKAYQDSVPALTESTPIGTVWQTFTSQPLVYKEFTQLFGAFLEIEVQRNAWRNPLGELIVSGTPLGEFSAVVGANPAQPREYDPNNITGILQYAHSSDKVIYYARNIKEFFKVSFAYEDMKGAFRSYEKFDEYMSMKLATLESGKQISTYNHIMEALVVNYFSGVFVESDVHISKNTTNYADWLTEAKNAIDNMQFPSTAFNKYSSLEGANGDFVGWSMPEDIYIIATTEWINKIDVSYLAAVFNLDKAEIGKRIRKVPKFAYTRYDENGVKLGEVESPIQAMIVDRRAFKFKNDLDLDTSFFNDETLVSNYWKHFWATYQINPLAQALVFTAPSSDDTEQDTNFYNIEYNQPSTTTIKNTSGSALTIQLTTSDEVIEGSSGAKIAYTEPELDTADYEPETADEAINIMAYYTLGLLTNVRVDGYSTDTSMLDFVDAGSSVPSGGSKSYTFERTSTKNVYKAQKLVIVEADVAQSIDEVSVVITDEMFAEVRAKYGNSAVVNFTLTDTDGDIEPVTLTIGLKNKI